jgi:mannose-1-phosphate guanylyltransferase/phosphomannomutase
MKAVIMAGGEGTRLRPLTCNRPKPMVPVAGRPVMEHTVRLLKNHGMDNIAVTLQYLPDRITEYFGDGSSFGVRMRYYIEDRPLGTAGSVKNAEDFLDETFLVISGDALTDIDLAGAVSFHREKDAVATLVLKRVDVPLEYGVVVTDADGRIIRFIEKPGWGEVFSDTVNTGIYILSPEIFSYYGKDRFFDFSRDLFPMLMKENRRMYGYITDEYWCDIGDINAYMQANFDAMDGKVEVDLPGTETMPGVRTGKGTTIEEPARIEGPCIIGDGCYIKGGAVIGRHVVIGDNCIAEGNSSIKRSIIWKNSIIGEKAEIRGSVVCSRTVIESGASAFEGSVVGEGCRIGERTLIRPSVKIWPGKNVDRCMELCENLVWGSGAARHIFGNRGVTGTVNTDMTPEFAAKLGAAFAAAVKNRGIIGVCSDGTPAATMIRSALVSGLLSAGAHVNDYRKMLLPALRFAVRFCRLDGGIYAGTCGGSVKRLSLDFIDSAGRSIDRSLERKIESLFCRDDFGRCEAGNLRGVTEISDFGDFYMKSILRDIRSERLDFRVALRRGSDHVTEAVASLLAEAGCAVEIADTGGTDDMKQFCGFVRSGRFDIGVSIGETCEKMLLVDDAGRLVTEDMFMAIVSMVVLRKIRGSTLVVPISASQVIDRLAERYQGSVIRTRTAARDIMAELLARETKEELAEQFTMHFDAAAGLVKLMDFMKTENTSLREMADMLPEIHMRRKEVECGWDAKGRVIRKIIQEHYGGRMEMLEGVKVYNDKGWVLVLPDAERPVCSVIGEGFTEEFAEELTNIYARKVMEISRS